MYRLKDDKSKNDTIYMVLNYGITNTSNLCHYKSCYYKTLSICAIINPCIVHLIEY